MSHYKKILYESQNCHLYFCGFVLYTGMTEQIYYQRSLCNSIFNDICSNKQV